MKEKLKGSKTQTLDKEILLQDYYSTLYEAYYSMLEVFRKREQAGWSQDKVASLLGVNKSLISRRLKGAVNFTLHSLSAMATALDCKLMVKFEPFEEIRKSNQPGQAYLYIENSNLPSRQLETRTPGYGRMKTNISQPSTNI